MMVRLAPARLLEMRARVMDRRSPSRRCRCRSPCANRLRVLGAERADIGDEMVDAAVAAEIVDPFLERGIVGDIERSSFDAVLLASPRSLALLHEPGVARAEADDRAFGHEGIDDGAADALGAAVTSTRLPLRPRSMIPRR